MGAYGRRNLLPHEEPLLTDQQLGGRVPRSARGSGAAHQPVAARTWDAGTGVASNARGWPQGFRPRRSWRSLAPDHRYPPATGGEPSPASGKGLWGNRSWTPHLGGVYIYAMNPQ